MTSVNEPVIKIENLSKEYPLFDSPFEIIAHSFGLSNQRWFSRFSKPPRVYKALHNISLEINKGQRIGVIGRNGAGKSTLLKIISGTTSPTMGQIYCPDNIQALFDTTVGFHPDLSGMDNIRHALELRLGADKVSLERAIEDVVDFVELGDFLSQPIKNYSKGMSTRLAFGVATAVKPKLIVIDEVLGAGDSYFSAKSARRMKSMLAGDTTLMLVSHSTTQVIQFCDTAIWMERGEVVMQDDSFAVVKAYEEFIENLRHEAERNNLSSAAAQTLTDNSFRREILEDAITAARTRMLNEMGQGDLQASDDDSTRAVKSNVATKSGISRWPQKVSGLDISRVSLTRADGTETNVVESGEGFSISISYLVTETRNYVCRFVVLFFTTEGKWLSRQISEPEYFEGVAGDKRQKTVEFEKNLFGAGSIIFTVALYESPDKISADDNYETLSRSFEFKVINKDITDQSLLVHPCEWK